MTYLSTRVNRSMPPSAVTPVLSYQDVGAAVDWLRIVFGFRERLRIGEHRAQLAIGDAASIVVVQGLGGHPASGWATHSIMVRIADVDAHHSHAMSCAARVVSAPASYPYGERQYTVMDLGGHLWTFSQTVADVDPLSWGGQPIALQLEDAQS
ncbi:MAG TPA: VOC family protein [Dyella sp.]|uniref:VOC family protein n=1 Tax=Dyella sp. TaxID=1869338 RepID=UPI002F920770